MQEYLNSFEIGFCFYDTRYEHINNFNYNTAPSGKLFKYYAAGVPVIGSNIAGLQSIDEFQTGIRVKNYTPKEILNACETIQANYQFYYQNCLKAAEHFSFDKMIKPFLEYIAWKRYYS